MQILRISPLAIPARPRFHSLSGRLVEAEAAVAKGVVQLSGQLIQTEHAKDLQAAEQRQDARMLGWMAGTQVEVSDEW